MDPLSFSASLIAISTLAVAALKTSLLLYDFAKELQAASEDIENFALDIQAFGFVIDTGHECLKDYCEREPTSQVLNYFKDLQIVHSLGKLSKRTNEQIDCACRQTESTQSRSKTLTQIKWVFRNRKLFDALYPDMASLRSSFTLVMLYITYEIAQKRGDSEETRQEVIRLKRQIKIQLDTIDLLQQSERRRLEGSGQTQFASHPASAPLGHNIQDRLSFLGTEIVEHDTVPDPEEYTPFSSRISVNEHARRSYAISTSPSHSQSSRPSNARSRRTELSATATSPISSVATTIESREVRVRPPELRQERRRIPSRHEQESSTSSSNPPGRLGATSPIVIKRASAGPTVEEDFFLVHPTTYHLKIASNLSHNLKSSEHYINSPTKGWIEANIWLLPKLSQNLISLAYAKKLGLQIKPPDEEDEPFWIEVDSGEERRSPGSVVLERREGNSSDDMAFRVHCLVYDHDHVRRIVFGAPFLKKRDYHLRRASTTGERGYG